MNQTPNDAPAGDSEIFVVGDLRVDIGQQRVMRSGTEITLPNLSFQLLVALIRGAPNVLGLDVLMARVWPGLIVSPETVNKRANLLREALGDDADAPRYISAVRSRGYRLVADVTREAATGESRIVPTKRSLRRWLGLAVLVVIVFAVSIVARYVFRDQRSSAPIPTNIPQSASAAVGTRARTVAVMPFENISADTNDAYLARGLPEMVLNRLSRVNGLTVIARNSSFAQVTTSIDSQEIGRRLHSGFLVNGSVQRKADRLRVAVQLVDAAAGTLVWSANFDRALGDIFTVEDEIADQVTGALSARLGGVNPKPVAEMRSSNVEAYLAYLQGRSLLRRLSVAESESAAPYFEKAIALDPNFAAAYASLYDARLLTADLRHEDLAPVRQRFRPLIDKALAIDPDSGAAYFARAMWSDAPFEARDADFRRGIALDPSNGRGLTAYAEFLDYDEMGWVQPYKTTMNYPVQREEAQRILRRALQIDPMSPGAHFDAATGGVDFNGAATLEQKMLYVLELDPEFVPALYQIGKYRWLFHDKLADAVQILERAIALDPGNPEPRHTAMAVYLDLGDEQAAQSVAAGTPRRARDEHLVSMFAGSWREAGRAVYHDGGWTYDSCGNWLAAEALRDYALKTGELTPAITFIRAKYDFGKGPAARLEVCNYHASVVLSQLLAAQGHVAEAQTLRRAAISWNDANAAKYRGNVRRTGAGALLLDGKRDAALDELAKDFRSGDYTFWWYTLKYDPVWLPLHGDPRFRAIGADVRRYIDGQRQALEDLRRRGIVPDARRLADSGLKPGIQ